MCRNDPIASRDLPEYIGRRADDGETSLLQAGELEGVQGPVGKSFLRTEIEGI